MCDIVRIVKGKRELLEVARSMYLYLLGVPVGSVGKLPQISIMTWKVN